MNKLKLGLVLSLCLLFILPTVSAISFSSDVSDLSIEEGENYSFNILLKNNSKNIDDIKLSGVSLDNVDIIFESNDFTLDKGESREIEVILIPENNFKGMIFVHHKSDYMKSSTEVIKISGSTYYPKDEDGNGSIVWLLLFLIFTILGVISFLIYYWRKNIYAS